MTSDPVGSAPAPKIIFKDITATYKVRRVEIPPGGVVPPYRVDTGYVVFTVKPATVRRTTYRDGKVYTIEVLQLDPAKPFYVPGFDANVQVSIENIGTDVAVFGKFQLPSPDYSDYMWNDTDAPAAS